MVLHQLENTDLCLFHSDNQLTHKTSVCCGSFLSFIQFYDSAVCSYNKHRTDHLLKDISPKRGHIEETWMRSFNVWFSWVFSVCDVVLCGWCICFSSLSSVKKKKKAYKCLKVEPNRDVSFSHYFIWIVSTAWWSRNILRVPHRWKHIKQTAGWCSNCWR